MTAKPGAKLGPYEILSLIGAGGMGEVYKARDSRLNRTVAVKILSSEVSSNAELRARFEREAQTLASLSHPHICSVFDVGRQDSVDYIVMEFLEGQTLTERLAHGKLSIAEAVKVGKEIADALDKAHQKGLVHRDVKPSNIMLTKSGAKLLDFGLAKIKNQSPSVDLSALPTKASVTIDGAILGTLQYMAPEQLEGIDADARSDIFALGSVLYEMVSGAKAFPAKSQAALIGSILKDEPAALGTSAPAAPELLRRTIDKCLKKDPAERWQSCSDIVETLGWTELTTIPTGGAVSHRALSKWTGQLSLWRNRLAWVALGILVSAVAFVLASRRAPAVSVNTNVVRASIEAPPGTIFDITQSSAGPVAVSPDGSQLVFSANRILWIRRLDGLESQALKGTEGAYAPFWSPDSKSIGFGVGGGGELRRLDIGTGAGSVICKLSGSMAGASWGDNGDVIFADDGLIYFVNANGGVQKTLAAPDPGKGEYRFRNPQFLPARGKYLFRVQNVDPSKSGIYVGSVDSPEKKLLIQTDSNAQYVAGWLLYVQRNSSELFAQRFDVDRMELPGEPQRVIDSVGINSWPWDHFYTPFSASPSGVLAYHTSSLVDGRLVWLDRTGNEIGQLGPTGYYSNPEISPDGTQVAVDRFERQKAQGRIWLLDILRGTAIPMRTAAGSDVGPAWSSDGNALLFTSDAEGRMAYYVRNIKDNSVHKLADANAPGYSKTWSSTGDVAFYSRTGIGTGLDVDRLDLKTGKIEPFLNSGPLESQAQVSPDGHWLAYNSSESGRAEIYVESLLSRGKKWPVSTNGGAQPRWRADGKELFYQTGGNLYSVTIRAGAGGPSEREDFLVDLPKLLFKLPQTGNVGSVNAFGYNVTRDGQRILYIKATDNGAARPMTIVINWPALLKKDNL